MSRRRVAWLLLGAAGLALCIAAMDPMLELALYEHVECVESGAKGSVRYFKGRLSRWSKSNEWRVGTVFHCVFMSGRPPLVRTFDCGEGRRVITVFDEGGLATAQSDPFQTQRRPWTHPVPYSSAEVRQLIHEAKLYVQAAAQRGEVQLPPDWEAVE